MENTENLLKKEYLLSGSSSNYGEWLEQEIYSLRTQIMLDEIEGMMDRKRYIDSLSSNPMFSNLNN